MGESSTAPAPENPPFPPPPTQRRPRVREVSSRFMSPVSSSSTSCSPVRNNRHRSSSVEKQRQTDTLPSPGENRDLMRSPPQRKRSVVKLFKENNGPIVTRSHRPDTPTVTNSSKLRLMQQRATPVPSAATRLMQKSGLSSSRSDLSELCDVYGVGASEGNPLARSCSTQSLPDLDTSSRLLVDRNNTNSVNNNDRNADGSKFIATPCCRSFDACENSLMHTLKATTVKKTAGLPLPPVPNLSRKAKKVSGHQEDVHYLRLLHNHYLQWRLANAKAEISAKAQKKEIEKTICSLSQKISELYDSVKQKRIELGLLRRRKALLTILEAQEPYLEEWSTLEADYSESLLEANQALMNVSLRLPIGTNVRADAREIGEALNSAIKVVESIASHVQIFKPKAEETDSLVSELARATGCERALIEECGDLLFTTHKSQVEECSLRSQLIQFQRMMQPNQFR